MFSFYLCTRISFRTALHFLRRDLSEASRILVKLFIGKRFTLRVSVRSVFNKHFSAESAKCESVKSRALRLDSTSHYCTPFITLERLPFESKISKTFASFTGSIIIPLPNSPFSRFHRVFWFKVSKISAISENWYQPF